MYYTRHNESANIFHMWTALMLLSVAVNRNCWMSLAYYNCYPNLYALFIGPSGVGKSSASSIGIELMMETSVCRNIYRDAITPPALLTYMSQSGSQVTFEMGGKMHTKTPLFVYAPELATLLSQRGSLKEMTSLLTELFNKQGDHEDTTLARTSIKIIKPIVSFLGCCPPGWVEEELPTATLRNGFLGRMCCVKANAKRFNNPEPRFTIDDLRLKEELKSDLEKISSVYGEMAFSDEAHEYWITWYNDQPLDFSNLDDSVEGFTARKPQFIQRIAMLLTLSGGNKKEIPLKNLIKAVEIIEECQVFNESLAIQEKVSQLAEYVVGAIARYQIRTNGPIPRATLMSHVSKKVNVKMLADIVEQLYTEGRIKVKDGKEYSVVKKTDLRRFEGTIRRKKEKKEEDEE